ncbi:MAG: ParB N-terminal domain-containing protein [Candidatus Competibacteraceae bacterium]
MAKRASNRLLQSGAAEAGRAQAKQAQDWLEREQAERGSLALEAIQPRPAGDSRTLKPYYLIDLAESIAAVGLIEPPVVDVNGRLLDGGHRIAALRLLAMADPTARTQQWLNLTGWESAHLSAKQTACIERLQSLATWVVEQVAVMRLPFDAVAEPERALAIETSANTQRRDYTREELLLLVQRLRAAGYVEREGRPRTSQKALRPALSIILGKSPNTVRRWLGVLNDTTKTCPNGQVFGLQQATRKLLLAIQRFRLVAAAGDSVANPDLLTCLESAERLLRNQHSDARPANSVGEH